MTHLRLLLFGALTLLALLAPPRPAQACPS
jgi:hypothetical protein